ncbi:MAG: hypothetical protein AAGA43_15560 [Bacteroidota bacterium]
MEVRQGKAPNKINEQYILPVLFLLVNITVIIWFYILHEYSQSDATFKTKYHFDTLAIENYASELKQQLLMFSLVLLITPLYLKFKKRWLLVAITLLHLGALYYFFYWK